MDKNEFQTVNITLKVPNSEVVHFENELRSFFDVVDYRVVANTEKMYKEDTYFQKLVKQKKDLSNSILDYINRNNYKYNE